MDVAQSVGENALPGRYHFLLRRLHSLAGLVPLGVFVVMHLATNSTILFGPQAFQTAVDQIHWLSKIGVLTLVEVVGIFIPLAFHAVFGLVIWTSGESNAGVYRCGGNIRYTLQRVTGGIAFVFIMVHLWQMHWLGAPFGGGLFIPLAAAPTAAAAMKAGWVAPLYAIGIIAVVYHLANGIWTALITWGITIGPRSQRFSGYACTAFGIALGGVGLGALYGFKTYDGPPLSSPPVHASRNVNN